jgi:flagellar biosynthesis component FlhA
MTDQTRLIRTAAWVLIFSALVVSLCIITGLVTLVIVCAGGVLLAAALAWAQVEEWRKQRRKDAALARQVRGRVA